MPTIALKRCESCILQALGQKYLLRWWIEAICRDPDNQCGLSNVTEDFEYGLVVRKTRVPDAGDVMGVDLVQDIALRQEYARVIVVPIVSLCALHIDREWRTGAVAGAADFREHSVGCCASLQPASSESLFGEERGNDIGEEDDAVDDNGSSTVIAPVVYDSFRSPGGSGNAAALIHQLQCMNRAQLQRTFEAHA
ncbi:hypothetical protein FOMA001_g8683 [Fusarium oxysporum f. sp. matthiolae]|nr:hypothetical protein FOMA001_g8683 [Fusarium oxysporum f. sp. matthiolae]